MSWMPEERWDEAYRIPGRFPHPPPTLPPPALPPDIVAPSPSPPPPLPLPLPSWLEDDVPEWSDAQQEAPPEEEAAAVRFLTPYAGVASCGPVWNHAGYGQRPAGGHFMTPRRLPPKGRAGRPVAKESAASSVVCDADSPPCVGASCIARSAEIVVEQRGEIGERRRGAREVRA